MAARGWIGMAAVAVTLALTPALAGCGATGGTTEPRPTPVTDSAVPAGATVAFYGDSYTLGTGATSESRRWSSIVCTQRGWTEFNQSVNGLGFINNRRDFGPRDLPGQIIAAHPRLVFITMGLNDNFSYATEKAEIKKQITADFTRLSDALPDARIVVVEPFWYTDERPHSLEVIIGWVRSAASEIHADYIPGASRWLEHHPEWFAADGLHPNDAGYAHLAARMDAELAKLGL